MILPYPVIYVEDGIILLYFTEENIKVNNYNFVFYKEMNKVLCVFNNFYSVPSEFLEKNNLLSSGNKIYFMRYNFLEPEAIFCDEFVISQEFIIDLKAYNKFQELQKNDNVILSSKND